MSGTKISNPAKLTTVTYIEKVSSKSEVNQVSIENSLKSSATLSFKMDCKRSNEHEKRVSRKEKC
jgi:hypothetical protein